MNHAEAARKLAGDALDTLGSQWDEISPGERAIIHAAVAQVYATLAVGHVLRQRLAALAETPGAGDLADAMEEFGADSAVLAEHLRRFAGRHQDSP